MYQARTVEIIKPVSYTHLKEVVGIEGSEAWTERALAAAAQHGLADKMSFSTLNLFEVDVEWLRALGYFDRMLIDPPRDGACLLYTSRCV